MRRGTYGESPEYYHQLGAWIAYMAARSGQPIRFVNCSYCDHHHARQKDDDGHYHTVDGNRVFCAIQQASGA